MTEAALERRFVREVESRGGLCFKFVSPSNPGVPDRIVITRDGRVIFVELKTEIGRVANIQKWQHRRMVEHGTEVRVVKGLEQLKTFIGEVFA